MLHFQLSQKASLPKDRMINEYLFCYPKHIHHSEINTNYNYHIDMHGGLLNNTLTHKIINNFKQD